MAVLPILILLLGCLVLVLVRTQPARVQWIVSLFFSTAAWLSLLFLRTSLLDLSQVPLLEEPAVIILPHLALTDIDTWLILWNLLALLVAIILTMPARFEVPAWNRWVLLLTFFAGLSAAVLSSNVMTGLLLWTAMEGIALILAAVWGSTDGDGNLSRFSGRLIAISLLIVSGAIIMLEGGESLREPLRIAADISFTVSVFLLIGLPTAVLPEAKGQTLDADFAWLIKAAPAILGLTFLGKVFPHLSSRSLQWILLLGMLSIGYVVLRWGLSRERRNLLSSIAVGIPGITMVFATLVDGNSAGHGILATASALVTIMGILGLLRNTSRVYQILLVLVVFIICALPGFPGQGWLELGMDAQVGWGRLGLGGVGLILLSGLLWMQWNRERQAWFSEEALAKAAYWTGLGLLLIASVVPWGLERPLISGNSLIIPVALIAGSIGFAYLLTQIMARIPGNMFLNWQQQAAHALQRLHLPLRWIGNAIKWSANVFEGEAGMLWVLVVLQAVLLALLREGL